MRARDILRIDRAKESFQFYIDREVRQICTFDSEQAMIVEPDTNKRRDDFYILVNLNIKVKHNQISKLSKYFL